MKRLAYAAAALLLVVAALALLAPALVDTPAVRAELQRRLSEALQGQVTWETLEVALLPAPHGELRGVRIEIPGRLSAAADGVDAYLRLWPLLRGRPELASVSVRKPVVRIVAAGGDGGAQPDAMAAYRAALEPATRALRLFAPHMTLGLEDSTLEIGEQFVVRGLRATARTDDKGVALEAVAASNLWQRLSVEARVEYADLSGRASVALDALALDKDVPPATLRAKLRTDGARAIECAFDGAAAPLVPAAKGSVLLAAGMPPKLSAEARGVGLERALALARAKGASLGFIEASRGRVSARADLTLGSPWHLEVELVESDAALKLAPLPWMVSAQAGRVTVTPESVSVAAVQGSIGDSTVRDAAARIELGKTPRLSSASGSALVKLEQWLPWLKVDPVESLSGSAEVTLKRLALGFDRPADLDFEALVVPRKAGAGLKDLPAPVVLDGGALQVTRKQVSAQGVAVTMLDARALVSGTFGVERKAVELALAEGSAGEKLVRWAMERAQAPARFAPKTPLGLAARRVAWAPESGLQAEIRAAFPEGQTLEISAAWRPERLELPRVSIKDARSDATMSATLEKDLVHASFSGTLQGHSIPAMLRQPLPADSGTARGKLRLTIDRRNPERTVGEGRVRIEALDLSWLAGRKTLIERAEIVAEADGARIVDARFGVDEQFFDMHAVGRRTERGPVIEARLESEGVDVYRLLPPPDPNVPRKKTSALWPLPVSGRVELRTGFAQYKDYRIAPFDGVLSLEPRRARLEVKEARMCGLSFPMEIEMTPEDNSAAVHLRAQDEPLERTVRCLTGGRVELTGSATLSAELRTRGRRPHLLRDMTGSAQAEVRDGQVRRFALIGNILSFRNIASPHRMLEEGFAYRSMSAKGRFEGGAFLVEESFFDSDAVRLAASGRVDLLGPDSQLDVLVGLFTSVDRIAEAIPIIGDIFGGSMTAIPMAVHGDIRDPLIVPLGPRAVTGHLLGIFERMLKLPGKLAPAPQPKP